MLIPGIIIGFTIAIVLMLIYVFYEPKAPCEHVWITERSEDRFSFYPSWMYYKQAYPQRHYQKCTKCGKKQIVNTG